MDLKPKPLPARRRVLSVEDYVSGVLAGDRTILARAITLIESSRREHEKMAHEVLQRILPHTGKSIRVGVTGVPGAGKSTLIENLGRNLIREGHHVAVLAIDPTSSVTGGSILGDKTRMYELANDPNAFIRPSPTSGTLGGVAPTTRRTMFLCEAAGFDVTLIETVGVGQSETVVADMVDFFLVLMLAGAGDELQGIKKGILELADMIVINKAEGDCEMRARRAAHEYQNALRYMRPVSPNWRTPVLTASGLHNIGLRELWDKILDHRQRLTGSGELAERRRRQMVHWMWQMIEDHLMADLRNHAKVKAILPTIERDVFEGRLTPTLAVSQVLEAFGKPQK